jgi:hypothetical protein
LPVELSGGFWAVLLDAQPGAFRFDSNLFSLYALVGRNKNRRKLMIYNLNCVGSSTIKSASYDDITQELIVSFYSGGKYSYNNVPYSVFQRWQMASSKGTYHADFIKDKYHFIKLA